MASNVPHMSCLVELKDVRLGATLLTLTRITTPTRMNSEGYSSEEKRCSILTRINNQTSDLKSTDAWTIAQLYQQYNETMGLIERGRSASRVDLLQKLPPELSLRCIQESLPDSESMLKSDSMLPDVNYTQQLLNFTMVSAGWRDFLISARPLWAYINVWAEQEDSMATMSLFLELSGAYPIRLTIWDTPAVEWDKLKVLLVPHQQRICNVDMRDMYPHTDEERFALLYSIARSLPDIPHTSNVNLGDSLRLNPRQLELAMQDSKGYIMKGAEISLSQIPDSLNILSRLGEIVISSSPSEVGNLFNSMVHISGIWIIPDYHARNRSLRTERSVLSRRALAPPGLTRFISHGIYHIFDECLLDIVASASDTLIHLEIQIPASELRRLLDCLASLVHLKELEIRMENSWSMNTFSDASMSYNPLWGLKKLTLQGELWDELSTIPKPDPVAYTTLIEACTVLYPNVEALQMKELDFRFCQAAIRSCLENLESLEYLVMWETGIGSSFHIPPPIITQCLRRLHCNPDFLRYLHAPKLEWLSTSVEAGERLDTTRCRSLLGAHIHLYSDEFYTITASIHAGNHAALEHLTLELPSVIGWQMPSLPCLKSIKVASRVPLDQNATLLCLSILYRPSDCPMLDEIELNGFVEWDIMMLMLERRNLRTDGVRRISNLKVPLVPPLLQSAITSLLGGKYCERPSNKDICAETAAESLCSPDIHGCVFCVKNMIPGCKVKVVKSDGPSYPLDRLYRNYPEPPPSHPLDTLLWLLQQNERMYRWQRLWVAFADTYKRRIACTRYLSNDERSNYRSLALMDRNTYLSGETFSINYAEVPLWVGPVIHGPTKRIC